MENNIWENLKPIDLTKIKEYPFPKNKFFQIEYNKVQIVLHHTVSGPGVEGDIESWINNKDNVAVAIIIDRDGTLGNYLAVNIGHII